jgi:16S rRNA (uracil1498-N3)-methyltransferase
MRIQRVYTDQPLRPGGEITLEEEPSHHLHHVLRLQAGDGVRLFNDGREYAATLGQVDKYGASVLLHELLREEPAPPLGIHLLLGISRGERMDYALQKATELGVTRITPVFTRRCVVKLNEKKQAGRMGHWHKILINACEQSGRCRLPRLDAPLEVGAAVAEHRDGTALLLDHRGEKTLLQITRPQAQVVILVGPEGGLHAEERQQAMAQGFTGVRLGPRVMRTETAPLAAIAAIQTLWGDFCEAD